MNELMMIAATAPEEDLDEVRELMGSAVAVNEDKGQFLVL